MKNLKELKKQADRAWVKYANAYQSAYLSEENLHQTIELKRLYELAEETFLLQKKNLTIKQKYEIIYHNLKEQRTKQQ